MIIIDGSQGEGGGQILRTSLALSCITGQPFTINRIRANRSKPGLLRQHLTAVRAVSEITRAEVAGAEIGSKELCFHPQEPKGGVYRFEIGTAGSVNLVLQTILFPLLFAKEPSQVRITGGTHNPSAPTTTYLRDVYLPLLKRMGGDARVTLERPGYFPAGGGEILLEVQPCANLKGFHITQPLQDSTIRATAEVAALPHAIGKAEVAICAKALNLKEKQIQVREITETRCPGNVLYINVESRQLVEQFTAFGSRSISKEAVAKAAIKQVKKYLKGGVPIGPHLADQLMLPLALAEEGAFLTGHLSQHSQSQLHTLRQFLPVVIEIEQQADNGTLVSFSSETVQMDFASKDF